MLSDSFTPETTVVKFRETENTIEVARVCRDGGMESHCLIVWSFCSGC